MNATAAAVIIIIVAAHVLAVMAGIGGYTLGRARAAEDTKKTDETLVYCRDKTLVVSSLLTFETEQAERYREIARQAVKALPSKDIRKLLLERELREADGLLRSKIAEVEEVTKRG
ncbi:hypothetical protein HG436_003510 [Candidatus Saccharibacteria bacterium]|nr:hypothetical protein [Candidatus Saccharibacteria bacterium]